MTTAFTISLPRSTSAEERVELETALRGERGVQRTRPLEPRSVGLDPASIVLWVQVAGGILTAAGGAVSLIERVMHLLRGKGIKGATITLPGGAVLQVDSASTRDIERLLAAAAVESEKTR